MKETKIISRRETMERKILNTITEYYKIHGYCPSFREIASIVNLRSTSSVKKYIDNMLQSGLLESEEKPGSVRAVRVKGSKFISPNEKEALTKFFNSVQELPCGTLCRHANSEQLTPDEPHHCLTCGYGNLAKEYEYLKAILADIIAT